MPHPLYTYWAFFICVPAENGRPRGDGWERVREAGSGSSAALSQLDA